MSDENLVRELQKLSAIGEAKKKEKEEKSLGLYLKRQFESIKNYAYAAANRGERSIIAQDKRDAANSAIFDIERDRIDTRLSKLLRDMGFEVKQKHRASEYIIFRYEISW